MKCEKKMEWKKIDTKIRKEVNSEGRKDILNNV